MRCSCQSNSSEATEKLGQALGRSLRGGEVIELVSDLGGGKTTFVRGLAKGFGSEDKVASPTFTLSKLYKNTDAKKEIHHFDFYRLSDSGVVAHELEELVSEKDVVIVVEWAEVVHHVLPEDRLTIRFKRTGDEARELEFYCPAKLDYLLESLC